MLPQATKRKVMLSQNKKHSKKPGMTVNVAAGNKKR